MKVKATKNYEKYNVMDKELKRIPKEGEEFEVTKERFEVLSGKNKFKVAFVETVESTKEAKDNKKDKEGKK